MEKKTMLPCKCGADARIRHREPYVWVECKKKCGMYSGYFVKCLSDDVKAERDAMKKPGNLGLNMGSVANG